MSKIEQGLVVAGYVVPGTEIVRRDPKAWWALGDRGARPRARVVDKIVIHATAGEAGVGSYEDDGPIVVRNLLGRKSKKTGAPLQGGFDFLIGACDPTAAAAPLWQTSDFGLNSTIHVGHRSVYPRSIGIEIVSALRVGPTDVRQRPRLPPRTVAGRVRHVVDFYPGQYATLSYLVFLLTGVLPQAVDALAAANVIVPPVVPGDGHGHVSLERMTPAKVRGWRGVLEHLHCPSSQQKWDAAGLGVEYLSTVHGFEAVP